MCNCIANLKQNVKAQLASTLGKNQTVLLLSVAAVDSEEGNLRCCVDVDVSLLNTDNNRSADMTLRVAGTFCPMCGLRYNN
jgi:hypothetical protein